MDFQRIGPWERFLEALFWNFLRAPYNRAFALSLGLRGDERVLEFGSGSGAVSRHVRPLLTGGGTLVCVDTSEGLMGIARRRLKGFPNVEFHGKDLRAAGFPAGSFDVEVVHFALHDVPSEGRAPLVLEMARLLRPGGRIVLREPSRPGHGMPPSEIRALACVAGLREVACHEGRRMGSKPFSHFVFGKESP